MTEKTEQGDYKTELRKKFDVKFRNGIHFENEEIFNFFYSEIEARGREIAIHIATNSLLVDSDIEETAANKIFQLNTKISHLEALLKAADDVINHMNIGLHEDYLKKALEAYNKLKNP